jgi:hypothetical protein
MDHEAFIPFPSNAVKSIQRCEVYATVQTAMTGGLFRTVPASAGARTMTANTVVQYYTSNESSLYGAFSKKYFLPGLVLVYSLRLRNDLNVTGFKSLASRNGKLQIRIIPFIVQMDEE